MNAIRLPFGWWLTRDNGIPREYPPRARDELVRLRIENSDIAMKLAQDDPDAALRILLHVDEVHELLREETA